MTGEARRGSAVDRLLGVWQRRHWLGIVIVVLVAAAAGSLAAFLPDLYRAKATVLVERRQVPESFVRSSITGELETRLQTISQEVLSRARLEQLITRFNLYPAAQQAGAMEGAVETMRRDVTIEVKGVDQPGGRVVTVAFVLGYRGRDPQTVAAVTNALAEAYVEENVRLREQQAAGTAAFLRGQLAETKRRLDEQESRVRAFRSRWVGELPQQVGVNMATLERLHAQLHLASANQLRAVDRRAALDKQLAELDTSAAAPETGATKLTKLKQELAELRRRFTDAYPDVIRLRAEVARLEQDLATAEPSAPAPAAPRDPATARVRAAMRDADAEIAALKAEEQRVRNDIAAYQRRVDTAPQREQELQELSRDYDMTKDVYASLLKRYEDAQLAETMEQRQRGEQFRILDAAIPSRMPAAPNRLRLLLVGVALALAAGAGAMMLAEHLDTSFHTVDDLRALDRAPVLLSIPLIVSASDARQSRRRFRYAGVGVLVAVALVIKGTQFLATGNEMLVALLSRGGS
jgi:polysaccharide biosynthesis transport protein